MYFNCFFFHPKSKITKNNYFKQLLLYPTYYQLKKGAQSTKKSKHKKKWRSSQFLHHAFKTQLDNVDALKLYLEPK